MTDLALDDLERARLDWPDSLLIDTINTCYRVAPCADDTLTAARLHARFLHKLIEGDTRDAAFLRLELIACCAGRNIGGQAIEVADGAAFRELTRLVDSRFRNSPKMRLQLIQRLRDAAASLPDRPDQNRRTGAVHLLANARSAVTRTPVPAVEKRAAAG